MARTHNSLMSRRTGLAALYGLLLRLFALACFVIGVAFIAFGCVLDNPPKQLVSGSAPPWSLLVPQPLSSSKHWSADQGAQTGRWWAWGALRWRQARSAGLRRGLGQGLSQGTCALAGCWPSCRLSWCSASLAPSRRSPPP